MNTTTSEYYQGIVELSKFCLKDKALVMMPDDNHIIEDLRKQDTSNFICNTRNISNVDVYEQHKFEIKHVNNNPECNVLISHFEPYLPKVLRTFNGEKFAYFIGDHNDIVNRDCVRQFFYLFLGDHFKFHSEICIDKRPDRNWYLRMFERKYNEPFQINPIIKVKKLDKSQQTEPFICRLSTINYPLMMLTNQNEEDFDEFEMINIHDVTS